MDPEALVQLAQWHSLRGEVDQAIDQLANGVDAAPRGEWVQERAHRAYRAVGDAARACAHGVALRAVQKRPEYDQDDVLACEFATDLTAWTQADESADGATAEVDGGTEPTAAERKAQSDAERTRLGLGRGANPDTSTDEKRPQLRGDLQVQLTCTGNHDLDIVVLEPNGRALSWLSQRRKIKVAHVRARCHESFALPTMKNDGTYRVVVTRADGSGRVTGTAEVKAWGTSKSFPFSLDEGERSTRVAETERTARWRR
jgi:hypothetical protein